MTLTPPETAEGWAEFSQLHIAPYAAQIDREAWIPTDVLQALRAAGAFSSGFAEAYGGKPAPDPERAILDHGQMHEALGYASASVQGLVNVHHMGGSALAKWSTKEQRAFWVPKLTSGDVICAIAMTEAHAGSDISAVETWARPTDDGYVVNGVKRWITCGQSADIFVTIVGSDQGPLALILPKDTPGLTRIPIDDMLGCRGYMMADLTLEEVHLPQSHVLGGPGFGASHIAPTGLDAGRYNLAWGCVGLAQAACDAAMGQAKSRTQFGRPIAEFQLVQQLITRMITDIHAARLMCQSAGAARARRARGSAKEATMAKYFASQMANRVARDAQQIFGAQGIGPETPMARYFRDARVMEVIEGTTQVLESLIARLSLAEVAR